MAVDHFARQSQGDAKFAHLVFEQITQRFEQLQAELLGQAAHVVVAFDGDGFFGFGTAAFNHIRVNGALGQETGPLVAATTCFEFGSLLFEDRHKFCANDFAFGLGVGHTGQLAQKQITGIHAYDVRMQLAHKHVHHHVAFVQAQQTVVHKHAGELVANGAVDQRCSNRGIDAA